MRRALLAVLLLVPVGLAGCIGTEEPDTGRPAGTVDLVGLSPKLYDILPVEITWVASAADGKRMHNAVYRPDTDEPVPVFINFSPYWGDTAETGGDGFARYMVEEYVPRGYAVVLSAVRGTGHSEGCFQIGGDLELQDTYDVVDHFAGVEWSNGAVAAGGKSYDSTTQNGMIAKAPHPALKGVFHVSGITDMYRYNYRYGLPYSHGALFNTYYYLQGTDEYGLGLFGSSPEEAFEEDPESLARVVDDVACTEFPVMQASGVGSGAHGAKTDYWIERDWNRYIADSSWDGSVFFVHGLQDWNVKPDHILPWLDLLPQDVKVKGWLHQWTRDPQGGHVYPMRDDWNMTMLRWLDETLKGVDTGLWDEPAFDVQGDDDVWRASDTWPPFALQPIDTGLAALPATPLDGDRRVAVELATATTGPLRISGAPTLTLTVTPLNEDPALVVTLRRGGADGAWVNEAVLRAVYRDGLTEPTPVTVGQPIDVTLEFYPMDAVLPVGETWTLVFGDTSEMTVAPGNTFVTPDAPAAGAVPQAEYDVTTATLHWNTGSAEPGRVPQPTWIDCFAC